jgi:MoaA/NifB/PqqE/SkfB family radical SAM enzyme
MLDSDFNLIDDDVIDVELDLTGFCNAKCPLCANNYVNNHHLTVKNQRSIEEITDGLKKYKNLKYVRLVGTVSEPTLYYDFLNLCQYFVDMGVIIEICTNGDTHNEEWWYDLGCILTPKDMVYFTICGSTQELHETYRKGTNLSNILKNARSFRKAGGHNDYFQHILFDYNYDDLHSDEMNGIMSEFSNINLTKTYYTRDIEIYRDKSGISKLAPYDSKKYNEILKLAEYKYKTKSNVKIDCMSINDQLVHINQFGEVYPCYLFLEEVGGKWDQNYKDILKLKYKCCSLCEHTILELTKKNNCEIR